MKLQSSQIQKLMMLAKRAAKNDNHEICGFMIDCVKFVDLIVCKNKTKRGGGFSFYVNAVRKLQKKVAKNGNEIIGTFHSHPIYTAKPSYSDIHGALDDSFILIFDVIGKNIAVWHIKNLKEKKVRHTLISSD